MTEEQARTLAHLINNASGFASRRVVVPDQLPGNRSWGVRLIPGAWIYTAVDQVPDVGQYPKSDFGHDFHQLVGD
jgi:hypothetical protein